MKRTACQVQPTEQETMTPACFWGSHNVWRTRGQLTSCQADRATPGNGTVVTNITTAWMSSATMTCWIPVGGVWLRDTRPASAWRTAPVTTATTDALLAPHTPRAWVQDVMIPITQTSTASGLILQMWNLGTMSWRSVWTPAIRFQSLTTATTLCAVRSAILATTPMCQDVTSHTIKRGMSLSKPLRSNSVKTP